MLLNRSSILLAALLASPLPFTAQTEARAQVAELRSAVREGNTTAAVGRLKAVVRKPDAGAALRSELNVALRGEASPDGVEAMLGLLLFAHRESRYPAVELGETLDALLEREDRLIRQYALTGVEWAPRDAQDVVITTLVEGLMAESWSDLSARMSWLRALQATGLRGREELAAALNRAEVHPRRREWYDEALANWPQRE